MTAKRTTETEYEWSDDTLNQRLAEATTAAQQRELDYFRLVKLTPPDVNQEAVEKARDEAQRVKKVRDELRAEYDSKHQE